MLEGEVDLSAAGGPSAPADGLGGVGGHGHAAAAHAEADEPAVGLLPPAACSLMPTACSLSGGASDGGSDGGGGSSMPSQQSPPVSDAARQLAALLSLLEEADREPAYQKLWLDFRHITDELVFHGMRAQSPQLITPLANLCYKMLFRHEVFETFTGGGGGSQPRQHRRLLPLGAELRAQLPPKLVLWVKQLSYFLMHFPDVEEGIAPLRRLARTLRRRADSEPRPKLTSEMDLSSS